MLKLKEDLEVRTYLPFRASSNRQNRNPPQSFFCWVSLAASAAQEMLEKMLEKEQVDDHLDRDEVARHF